jgi:hypothetical protein
MRVRAADGSQITVGEWLCRMASYVDRAFDVRVHSDGRMPSVILLDASHRLYVPRLGMRMKAADGPQSTVGA